MAAVIIRMLADQIDTARREITAYSFMIAKNSCKLLQKLFPFPAPPKIVLFYPYYTLFPMLPQGGAHLFLLHPPASEHKSLGIQAPP